MTTKTSKALPLIAILALAGALLVAGCGGGSSSSSAPETTPTESSAPAGGKAAMAEGKTVFDANCASCHTLAVAKAKGTVGPNLDELMPSEAEVEKQVVNGGGPMPAFGKEEVLAPNEIEAVSAYVSSVAGK